MHLGITKAVLKQSDTPLPQAKSYHTHPLPITGMVQLTTSGSKATDPSEPTPDMTLDVEKVLGIVSGPQKDTVNNNQI